jgi:hypothetical protein
MKIDYPNAFSMNRHSGNFFPFCAAPKRWDNIYTFNIYPININDLIDLIKVYAQPIAVIFDVDHSRLSDDGEAFLTLTEVASHFSIEHDSFGSDIVSVAKEKLDSLIPELESYNHYNLHLLDLAQIPSEEEMIEYYFAYYDHKLETPLLKQLNCATLYLDSHDDCYLYIETRELDFLKAILARAIQIYIGTIICEEYQIDPDVEELPSELLEMLWPLDAAFTILREDTLIYHDRIQIAYSDQKYDFQQDQEYQITGYIEYHLDKKKYSLIDSMGEDIVTREWDIN